MVPAKFTGRSIVAVLVASTMVVTPATGGAVALAVARQAQQPAGPATPEPSDADIDLGWPRSYPSPKGASIIVYQPQISAWPNQTHMTALSAVSYQPKGASQPALGVVTIEADTRVSLEERLVRFENFQITETNFANVPREQLRDIATDLLTALPDAERILALDRILENIDKSQVAPQNAEGVKADPPKIFWSATPAILVAIDGDPIWSPIDGVDLQFAVNTNWDLFQLESARTFYLRNEQVWLKATALEGPWTPAGTLPGSFSKLPADDNWAEVKKNLPGRSIRAGDVPRVFVSTTAAELIALSGQPAYTAVTGTSLMWVSNTESDLFRVGRNGDFYYLVAGRWFKAATLDGPWTFATPSLPADFKNIPVEHERSRVLASVPGSDQANEAVLLATVPQTARVNKKEVKAPDVTYQGQPQFEKIDTTTVERAVNTDKDIFKVGDLYYLCFQGVWFMGKTASGPWEVASSVPDVIYKIPASSPSHHVTYVTVVEDDDDDDEWATFAYVAGYTGMMIAWGCVVWGSGWYYPPYVWYGGYRPIYYPYPRTYGMSAWYNPWTGAYGRGAGVYGPYGGAGWGASYNPRTGTYTRSAAAYGPYNSRAVAQAYNPRTGTYAQTRQGSNVYGSWGSTYVQRGDNWAQTSRVTNNRTGNTTRVTQGEQGTSVRRTGGGETGFVAAGEGGNIYAGQDGNVYRRQDGQWQKHEAGGGWSDVDNPERPNPQAGQTGAPTGAAGTTGTTGRTGGTGATTRPTEVQTTPRGGQAGQATGTTPSTMSTLERDSRSRTTGTQRTSGYSGYKSSGASRSTAGSYRPRPSGGGRRR